MKKIDRRIVRTRRALADALIALALEHGYENLTIRAVTDRAGVGYNTFYRHYLNLDELMTEILDSAFKNLVKSTEQATTPDGEVLAMFTFLSEQRDLLRVYVNLPWTHPARKLIKDNGTKLMHSRYAQQNTTSAPLEVSIDQLLFATYDLAVWYVDHMDEYTPEQMAVMHNVLVGKALEHQAIELRDDWMEERHQKR